MRVGLISDPGDTTALAVRAALERFQPGSAVPLQLAIPAEQPMVLDGHRSRLGDQDLAGLDLLMVFGLWYMDPVVPEPEVDPDWSLWQVGHVAGQQRYSAVLSLLEHLHRCGRSVINPPRAHLMHFMKAHGFGALQRAGVPLPPWICTNERTTVEAMRERHCDLIWRPATGRGAWQRFGPLQEEDLTAAAKPPILLAPAPRGAFHRTWVLDGEPLWCVRCEPPAMVPVEELQPGAGGDGRYGELASLETLERLTTVSGEALQAPLPGLMEILETRWMEVLFTLEEQRVTIYDWDVDPRLGWLPGGCRERLADALASRLLGRPAGEASYPHRVERPAPFLRRGLQILFDMEESKYPEPDPVGEDPADGPTT